MIITDFGAAYAPQDVWSPTCLPILMPLAPVAPSVPPPVLPDMQKSPYTAYMSQPAPVRPPITTPESADVMQPTRTFSLPGYGYPTPQSPPNPYGAPTRWKPVAVDTDSTMPTANEPTVETPEGAAAGSLEQTLATAAQPWYKRPLPLVGLTVGGGLAIVGAIILLRK